MTPRNPEENASSVFSMGTGLALDGLEQLLRFSVAEMPAVMCVNIGTLIRNHISHVADIAPANMYVKVSTEIQALTSDVLSMMRFANIQNPAVYFYWHGYTASIPQALIRKPSKAREQVNNAIGHIAAYRGSLSDVVKTLGRSVSLNITNGGVGQLPHKVIMRDIIRLTTDKRLMMLSHCPLDYHVINRRVTLRILESYTGKIGGKRRISEKLFNHTNIPFCGITHQLLGDKEQLKSPLSRKESKLLKDTAIADNWSLRPISDVLSAVKKLGFAQYVKID